MTEVTNPNDWSVFVCVCRRARIGLDVPRFCEEQSQPGGRERRPGCPKKRNPAPISGGRDCVDTICADFCSSPTSCRLCLLGPTQVTHHHRRVIKQLLSIIPRIVSLHYCIERNEVIQRAGMCKLGTSALPQAHVVSPM